MELVWVHQLHGSHCLLHQCLQCLVGLLPPQLPAALSGHKGVHALASPGPAPGLERVINKGPEKSYGPTIVSLGCRVAGMVPGPWRSRWSGGHSEQPRCTGGCPAPPLPHWWPLGNSVCHTGTSGSLLAALSLQREESRWWLLPDQLLWMQPFASEPQIPIHLSKSPHFLR